MGEEGREGDNPSILFFDSDLYPRLQTLAFSPSMAEGPGIKSPHSPALHFTKRLNNSKDGLRPDALLPSLENNVQGNAKAMKLPTGPWSAARNIMPGVACLETRRGARHSSTRFSVLDCGLSHFYY